MRIYELPYTAIASLAVPATAEYPLAADAGEQFLPRVPEEADPDHPDFVPGRIAVVAVPRAEGPSTLLVIEQGDWSVACPLTKGQLHRLTNAVGGRGTRSGVRPLSVDGEYVHLTGSPELLIVDSGDHHVEIPAGPKR